MVLFCSFIIISGALCAYISAASGGISPFAAFELALLCFAGCNVAYLAANYVATLFVHRDRHVDRPRPYYVWNSMQVAELVCIYSGLIIHINGEELLPKDTRYLFVSNHRSNLDPIVIMNRLRDREIAFVSKPENLKIPVIGKFIHECCFLPIDRENARNAMSTINEAADYIKSGVVSIGIYPEGTRSKSVEMREFHAGSFKIAQKAHAPIVVSAVRGTEKAAKRFFRATHVYIDILAVISADDAAAMKTVDLSDKVRSMLEEHFKLTEA